MRNQGADDPTGKRAGSPSTAIAAQNRVSRMRQEQIMSKDGKSHQQAHLIEKRKLIKERRLLQQKRAVVASVDPPSQNPAQQLDKMVDTPRRTKLISKPAVSPTPLLDSAQSPLRRMHHEPAEKTAPSTPSTPGKNGVSRLSKMQRMQKMKGINDHVKKGMSPKVCASTLSPPTMTSPPATENVPASKVSSLQRRQRQTSIRQNRIKRTSVIIESQPNSTPVNHTKTDDRTRTPPAMNSSVPHLPIASPTSDTDGLSDMNYTYGPTTDHSVDPTTDDEATLTSVRRIMTKEVNEPARDPYHHYHHLQAQSKQRDDPSFLAKWTNGNRPAQPEFPGVSNSGYDGFRGSSRPTATMGRTKRSSRKKWSAMDENAMLANTPGVFRTASSSDYDTDGDVSKTSRHSNVLDGPSQSQATDVNEFFSTSRYTQGNRRMDDDDRTFDYGDRDDDSNGSTSFMARQKREADSRRGVPSHEAPEALKAGPSALINKDDVEHYTKSLGTPAMRIGAGVVGVVTIGCFVLGPAGLLAGAAAVGVGIGIMQIPDEERNRLQDKVQKTVGRVHDKAVDATEKLSNSCASTYEESGIAEHLPQCLSLSGMESDGLRDHEPARYEKKVTGNKSDEPVVVSRNGQKASVASPPTLEPGSRSEMANNSERPRNKKVACLRHGKSACLRCVTKQLHINNTHFCHWSESSDSSC